MVNAEIHGMSRNAVITMPARCLPGLLLSPSLVFIITALTNCSPCGHKMRSPLLVLFGLPAQAGATSLSGDRVLKPELKLLWSKARCHCNQSAFVAARPRTFRFNRKVQGCNTQWLGKTVL